MAQNPLQQLSALGTSVWLDYTRRDMLRDGELARRIRDEAVTGMTSNPTIFEKAIAGSALYDDQITSLARQDLSPAAIFERIAIQDIRAAADAFRGVYDSTDGMDGYISLEVAPELAYDTQGTIDQARRLFSELDRPNVFIKVPATEQGIPAIRALIAEGINVNITLMFAVSRYEQVMDAYLSGLEMRMQQGQPLSHVASVASFFVSRVDTAVDALLDEKMTENPALGALRGKAAIANAKIAYERFQDVFRQGRFSALKSKGARIQKPLWASTSTKNPAYRDVMYVEELAGPDSVNTMPIVTLEAFKDHGVVRRTIDDDVAGAHRVMEALQQAGISMADVTAKLEADGVKAFVKSFADLSNVLEAKRQAILAGTAGGRPQV